MDRNDTSLMRVEQPPARAGARCDLLRTSGQVSRTGLMAIIAMRAVACTVLAHPPTRSITADLHERVSSARIARKISSRATAAARSRTSPVPQSPGVRGLPSVSRYPVRASSSAIAPRPFRESCGSSRRMRIRSITRISRHWLVSTAVARRRPSETDS